MHLRKIKVFVSKAASWGCLLACLLGCPWAASWVANRCLSNSHPLCIQCLPSVHREDVLQQHETQRAQTTNYKKETLCANVCNSRSTAPRVCYVTLMA